ncbi:hypothetical protein BGP_6626 [Beggiatoa sp. PS]|nr:hypothetical protein BGP_6626 [Beggiatoa sp. PS]
MVSGKQLPFTVKVVVSSNVAVNGDTELTEGVQEGGG